MSTKEITDYIAEEMEDVQKQLDYTGNVDYAYGRLRALLVIVGVKVGGLDPAYGLIKIDEELT